MLSCCRSPPHQRRLFSVPESWRSQIWLAQVSLWRRYRYQCLLSIQATSLRNVFNFKLVNRRNSWCNQAFFNDWAIDDYTDRTSNFSDNFTAYWIWFVLIGIARSTKWVSCSQFPSWEKSLSNHCQYHKSKFYVFRHIRQISCFYLTTILVPILFSGNPSDRKNISQRKINICRSTPAQNQ